MTREKTETTTKGKQVERNEPHQGDTASSPPPPHHPNCYCYRYREDDNKLLKPGDYGSLIASKNSTIQHKLIRAILSHIHKRGQGKQEVDEEFDESIWPFADDKRELIENVSLTCIPKKKQRKKKKKSPPPPPTTFLILRHKDHHLPPNFRRLRLTTASS
jgi:hypothetical protein